MKIGVELWFSSEKPVRDNNKWVDKNGSDENAYFLDDGTIAQILHMKMTWENEPYEINY